MIFYLSALLPRTAAGPDRKGRPLFFCHARARITPRASRITPLAASHASHARPLAPACVCLWLRTGARPPPAGRRLPWRWRRLHDANQHDCGAARPSSALAAACPSSAAALAAALALAAPPPQLQRAALARRRLGRRLGGSAAEGGADCLIGASCAAAAAPWLASVAAASVAAAAISRLSTPPSHPPKTLATLR